MDKIDFGVENDLNVVISTKEKGIIFDEKCCTLINIMLTNDGKIATSFLGVHNPFIVTQLEKAQKAYFRELKKTLKKDFKEYENMPIDEEEKHCHCDDDNCHCNNDKSDDDNCKCDDNNCKCDNDNCKCDNIDCDCDKSKTKNDK